MLKESTLFLLTHPKMCTSNWFFYVNGPSSTESEKMSFLILYLTKMIKQTSMSFLINNKKTIMWYQRSIWQPQPHVRESLPGQSKDLEVRLFYSQDKTAVTETINIPAHLNRLIHSHFIFSSPFLSRLIGANPHIWEVMFPSSWSFRQGANGQTQSYDSKEITLT